MSDKITIDRAAAEALQPRIDAAIKRITDGQACMRIPADLEDPDLVLAECRSIFRAALSGAGSVGEAVAWRWRVCDASGRWSDWRCTETPPLPCAITGYEIQPLYAHPPTSIPAGHATDGWQPIETAPRGSGEDGPHNVTDPDYVEPPRLLLATAEGILTGYYDWYYHPGYGMGAEPGETAWRTTCGERVYDPTHWMPLPAAPAAAMTTTHEKESEK